MRGWWSDDPLVRLRAADATEKVTRKNPDLLKAYKKQLLKLLPDGNQGVPAPDKLTDFDGEDSPPV